MSHRPYSYEELLLSSTGELLGPEFAQLPAPNMLMMDRITEMQDEAGEYGRGLIKAELDIRPDLWFFDCHFPSDPVMPGCLGLDAMWQLSGFFLATMGLPGKGRALGVGEVKFTGQVMPTAKLVTYTIDVKRVIKGRLKLIIADGSMAVDGQQIYTAKNLRVGLFDSPNDM